MSIGRLLNVLHKLNIINTNEFASTYSTSWAKSAGAITIFDRHWLYEFNEINRREDAISK